VNGVISASNGTLLLLALINDSYLSISELIRDSLQIRCLVLMARTHGIFNLLVDRNLNVNTTSWTKTADKVLIIKRHRQRCSHDRSAQRPD
jgi:hypothetical protein